MRPDPDDLEIHAARGVHPYEDGRPLPVAPPHQVLLEAIERQRLTLSALITWLEHEGLLTRAALDDLRREVQAQERVDASMGLLADLVAEGAVEPWPAGALARAEAAHPCGCHHEVRDTEDRAP